MRLDTLFQYRAYNEHESIKAQAEVLFLEFQASRKRKIIDKNSQQAFRKCFKIALAGLYLGKAFDQYESFVRIPLNNNHYTGKTRISPVFQTELLKVFHWLIDNQYLEQVQPAHQVENIWKPAGYRLTRKWLSVAVHTHQHDPIAVVARTCRNRALSFVELRDGKKSIRLKASAQKNFSVKLLEWYEESLCGHKFSIGSVELPSFPFSLTRIYSNKDYWTGGRFYSLFQSRKSQTRLHLRIDDEPVCEVDYRYLHPALLHAAEGLELEYDPYEVEGFSRTIVKVAFQVLINTQKPFPAANSLMFFLNKAKRRRKNWGSSEWQGQEFTKDYCLRLSQAIAERNKPIAHHFSTGAGLKLQHTDSILVSAVLDFVRTQSPRTVVIPIHDSFVVKQSELEVLLEALGYAESILSKVKGYAIRTPTLKATVLGGTETSSYLKLIQDYKLEGGVESSFKEEELVHELNEFIVEDADDLENYEFDAGIEEEYK